MADQSPVTHQKKIDRRAKKLNTAMGLSKSLIHEGNEMGFSGFHNSLDLKKKDSTRIPDSDKIDVNQDHKRRCLEKLVVRKEQMTQRNVKDVNCALEVEVIDDTALIEATAAVSRFKKRYDLGFGKNQGNGGGLRNPKEENEGKKKRNKGFKKQGTRCLMKCVNEKKSKAQLADHDKTTSEKQIPEGKGQMVCRKMPATVKYVYQKKETKNPKFVASSVKEHLKVESRNALEKNGGEAVQETVVNLKVSIENEKESTMVETDVNLKVQIENEKGSTIKLVESEAVNENNDGSKSNPQDDVHIHNEAEDQSVCANTNIGSKKGAYSREEMETLRFVDQEGQKTKWAQVYQGFASSVAREYTGLVVDTNNRPPQRYNRMVNCGSNRHANAILGMPPALPLCSPSSCRKFESCDRVQGKFQLKSPS